MATAKAGVEDRAVTTYQKMAVVHLTLDFNEANTLMDMLNHVGGDPDETRRGIADDIAEALLSAGVRRTTMIYDLTGNLRFTV